MRKDKGLNGDLDRLPMITWIMFLKFLDDLEIQREGEAKLAGKKFKAAIEPPYRWRDWAAKSDGITGDELLSFINSEESSLPNGKKGPGLFRYLRLLTSSDSAGVADTRRDVIATVFKGVQNRMVSGYLLRDVINKLNGIHFTASDELHTLGALYESMLREMRDAAGDSGEFYTPRAVVRFMVTVTNPRLGETVLDPASGTGGFLVEAFNHLSQQVKTVADRKILQETSLFGCEPKTLPYLLCQMNLLLHGLDAPQIDPGNSLRFKLTDIGERDRVDVILTNPPFGGEEEKGIQGNFPEDKQTAETALLFLQLIMRKLKKVGTICRSSGNGGAATPPYQYARAAVVVPNGTLFGDGVCARIKEELLKEFNLHTIVRLPNGVFAPYTGIPTNLLFFDRSGPTREVWYYEHPLPAGRKNYTKTAPIQFEEFAPLVSWWNKREENEHAWKVPVAEFLDDKCDLDRKNPRGSEDFKHLPPEKLADDILKKSKRIADVITEVKSRLVTKDTSLQENVNTAWEVVPLGKVLKHRKEFFIIDDLETYKRPRVQLHAQGILLRDEIPGALIKTKKQQRCRMGEFLVAEIDAKVGGFGIVPPELDGSIVSSHYFLFVANEELLDRRFLGWFIKMPAFRKQIEAQGSTNYAAIRPAQVLGYEIPLPPLSEQRRIVARIEEVNDLKQLHAKSGDDLNALLGVMLYRSFKGAL
jgi:type I restriction enzyme M protein